MKFSQCLIVAIAAGSVSDVQARVRKNCTPGEISCRGANHFKMCEENQSRSWNRVPAGFRCESDTANGDDLLRDVTVTVTNLAYAQPLSGFFVGVHNDEVSLYQSGEAASGELADLAENGNPSSLVDAWNANSNVAEAFSVGGPTLPGNSVSFDVTIRYSYPNLSFASMAVNTNDCFIALNGMTIDQEYHKYMLPGLDAGSEENNEDCASIPGPACGDTGNVASGNGEGFVHVHRGVHGIADLDVSSADWRNPMVRVTIVDKEE